MSRRIPLLALVLAAAAAGGTAALLHRGARHEPASLAGRANRDSLVAARHARTGAQVPSGEQPPAFGRPGRPQDKPLHPVEELDGLTRRVADESVPGHDRALFVGRNSAGRTCLILQDAVSGGGGGCNPSADPFQGSTVWFGTHVLGGPALAQTTALTIFGVASSRVGSARIEDSAGGAHDLTLSDDGGFIYDVPASDLAAGVVPVAIATYGPGGRRLERVTLRLDL